MNQNLTKQYIDAVNQLEPEMRECASARETVALSLAIGNMNNVLVESLYRLLNN